MTGIRQLVCYCAAFGPAPDPPAAFCYLLAFISASDGFFPWSFCAAEVTICLVAAGAGFAPNAGLGAYAPLPYATWPNMPDPPTLADGAPVIPCLSVEVADCFGTVIGPGAGVAVTGLAPNIADFSAPPVDSGAFGSG